MTETNGYTYSQTALNYYLVCPLKCYFRLTKAEQERKFQAMLVGIGIHEAINRYHKDGLSIDDMLTVAQKSIYDESQGVEVVKSKSAEGKMFRMSEIFEKYIARDQAGADGTVVESELYFNIDIGEYQFAGIIDQIRERDGTFYLYDLKTDSKEPDNWFLKENMQFSLYYMACKSLGYKPISDNLMWYQLLNLLPYKRKTTVKDKTYFAGDNKDPIFLTTRSENEIERAKTKILTIIKAIENKCFWRNPNKFNSPCYSCPYTLKCSTFNMDNIL